MAGPIIDHMVSITVLVTALMLTFGLYNQIYVNALAYQRNHQVVMKAVDLMNTICLTTGNPPKWGQTNSTLLGFGLQDPESAGYALSPYSIMRLLSSSGEKVYYNVTGEWYSNVSWGFGGGYLLVPESDCINYTTVSRLLGTNDSYGFQLSVTPTLNVSVSEVQLNPLKLSVEVRGPGSLLGGATLNYLMFWTLDEKDNATGCPLLNFTSGSASTNSAGLAYLNFPQIKKVDQNKTAYTIIVNAYLGGLYGVGYKSREAITNAGNIIPFVESFENGTVLLAHKWGKNDPDGNQGALHFSATFYVLSDNFAPINIYIQNSTGLVNYGKGKPFHRIQIPTSDAGFLVVAYCKGNEFGMVIMPWGISTLGVSVTFGGDPSGHSFVATELRQVTVNAISYQVKLAVWRLHD